jgi:hypothetical protein
MDSSVPHLCSHREAETVALELSLALNGLGVLLGNLEKHLGEMVIFDPDARIKEAVLRDGITFGRMLAQFLVERARKSGLGPEPVLDQWDKLILTAVKDRLAKEK